ncbi:MAG: hypothetical protein QW041_02865 [Candidatus Pacearchaeota archaeon]
MEKIGLTEMKYFKCNQCASCCPKEKTEPYSEKNTKQYPSVHLNLSDLERIYRHANPKKKPFLDLFNEICELTVSIEDVFESSESSFSYENLQKVLQDPSTILFMKKITQNTPTLFSIKEVAKPLIRPKLKSPCYYLDDKKCVLHESIAMPLMCRIAPEYLILYGGIGDEEKTFFKCLNEKYKIPREKAKEIKILLNLNCREFKRTIDYFSPLEKLLPKSIYTLPKHVEIPLKNLENTVLDEKAERFIVHIGDILDKGNHFISTFLIQLLNERGPQGYETILENMKRVRNNLENKTDKKE